MNLKSWAFSSEVSTSGLQTLWGLQWSIRRVYEQAEKNYLLQRRRHNLLLPFSIIQKKEAISYLLWVSVSFVITDSTWHEQAELAELSSNQTLHCTCSSE